MYIDNQQHIRDDEGVQRLGEARKLLNIIEKLNYYEIYSLFN